MNSDSTSYMRRWLGAFTPVWKREESAPPLTRKRLRELDKNEKDDIHRFTRFPGNCNVDIYTKTAVLKAHASVVSLKSYSGEKKIFQCSGTIIESGNTYSIILTAASLLKSSRSLNSVADDIKVVVHLSDGRSFDGQIEAFDFRYNIAAVKIQSDTPLPSASLAHLNDSITVDPNHLDVPEEESFQLTPHSSSFDLIPGDLVIALGRFLRKPYSIMAAPGFFSTDRCKWGCTELLRASCRITRCGNGGPLINRHGKVIGICMEYKYSFAFLPVNIASLWWEHYKKYRRTRRPCSGMKITNLYAAPIETLERIIQKFPEVLKGVLVEKVVRGSPADAAGIKFEDVIIQFGGKKIQGVLELFENMWNNVGESAKLVVIREGEDDPLSLSMVVDEASCE